MQNKINWNKYTKQDREFLINVTLSNRDFTTTVAIFIYSGLISVTALIISIYSVMISAIGFNLRSIKAGIFILIIIVVLWTITLRYFKRSSKKFITNLNSQYQNIHRTIHPELFSGKEEYYY